MKRAAAFSVVLALAGALAGPRAAAVSEAPPPVRISVPLVDLAGTPRCRATPGASGGYWTAFHCVAEEPRMLFGEVASWRRLGEDLVAVAAAGAGGDEVASLEPGRTYELRSDRPSLTARYAGGAWCRWKDGLDTIEMSPVEVRDAWPCAVLCHADGRLVQPGDSGAGFFELGGGPAAAMLVARERSGEDRWCAERQRITAVALSREEG